MQTRDALIWIYRAVRSQPLRTFLSALGIAIGIAAVVLLTSIGKGLQVYVVSEFTQFGSNILSITPGKTATLGIAFGAFGSTRPLTLEDALAVEKLPDIEAVIPVIQGNVRVEAQQRQRRTEILGVGPGALSMWKLALQGGSFLPEDDALNARAVAVLGNTIYRELFPDGQALGKYIRLGDYRFRVVGYLQEKGRVLGFDMDTLIYIPAARAQEIFNRDALMEIDVAFNSNIDTAMIVKRLSELLQRRHNRVDFTLTTQGEMLASLDKILQVLTLAVGALGGISLLVGGVGIVTLMTITVTERIAEIGLLKALGAEANQVLLLFLGEALLLALLGGFSGLAAATLIITLCKVILPSLPLQVSLLYSVIAVVSSALIGLIAGVAPARSAAKLDPIEALRSE